MDVLLSFLLAFLVGGALCALFQLFMMLTKLKPPVILIIGFSLGAILLPFGAIAVMEQYGGAGMAVMVMDAGAGMYSALAALLQGTWVPFATVVSIFLVLTLIGIAAGAISSSKEKLSAKAARKESFSANNEEVLMK
jgi:MFS family permease